MIPQELQAFIQWIQALQQAFRELVELIPEQVWQNIQRWIAGEPVFPTLPIGSG